MVEGKSRFEAMSERDSECSSAAVGVGVSRS